VVAGMDARAPFRAEAVRDLAEHDGGAIETPENGFA
jgi:hypothetical protein